MSILLVSKSRDMAPVKDALLRQDSNLDVEIWPHIASKQRVNFAVSWKQPDNVFNQLPNLKVVSSLGAGVDHLIDDPSISSDVIITRVVAPSLTGDMSDYVMTAVLNYFRHTHTFYKQQQNTEWNMILTRDKKEVTVGVMGLGELGEQAAKDLRDLGFRVNGWARSKKEIEGVQTFTAEQKDDFLQATNIVVCLLPLTDQTEDILDLELFKKLKKPAHVINVGRGDHLVEEDLIYALDADILESATLDVFRKEPLPESHAFWNRENIIVTPHIASVSDPDEAAVLLVENYKRMLSGMELKNRVDLDCGY